MPLDEELLEQMNRLETEEETSARKAAWEREALTGIQAGELQIKGTMIEFHRESLFEAKVSIMVPNTFTIMDPELAAFKYPSEHRPDLIFSNESGSITLGFNHTRSQVKEDQIENFKDYLIQNLQKMQPSITILEDGIKNINEQPVGYFEFISSALDSDIYNLMFFTELEGRVLLGNFNCLEKDLEQWQGIAKGMLETIRIEIEAGNFDNNSK